MSVILPSIRDLQELLDTLALRDGEDLVTVTMPLDNLRQLVDSWLTEGSPPTYTSKGVGRR